MTEQASTALVHVRPDVDPRITALYQEGVKLQEYAEARVIQSDDDVKVATDDLTIIAKLQKAIEEARKGYVGPLNEYVKTINATFAGFVEPIKVADTITRGKVMAYRREQERLRQEQEEINRLREEASRKEMELTGELSEPVGLVQVAPEAPVHYRRDTGMLGTAKNWKWEVEDLTKVPLEYIIIDAAKLGKVVRAGLHSIPGIRIWPEESLRVTTARTPPPPVAQVAEGEQPEKEDTPF